MECAFGHVASPLFDLSASVKQKRLNSSNLVPVGPFIGLHLVEICFGDNSIQLRGGQTVFYGKTRPDEFVDSQDRLFFLHATFLKCQHEAIRMLVAEFDHLNSLV